METILIIAGVVLYFGIGFGLSAYCDKKERAENPEEKRNETEEDKELKSFIAVFLWPIVLVAEITLSIAKLISPIKKNKAEEGS